MSSQFFSMKNELLRHTVATIRYRFLKSIENRNEDYGFSSLGHGSRTPLEIIDHMIHVIRFAILQTEKMDYKELSFEKDIEHSAVQFEQVLSDIDNVFSEHEIDLSLSKKLLQGPLADVLTHIGQLSMLSRIFADPVKGENYFVAKIE